jgi:hypothetical protein
MTSNRTLLCYGWSNADHFYGTDKVPIVWYRHDKRTPLAEPYEELIDKYSQLNWFTRKLMRDYVNEHFTKTELEALRAYIKSAHNWELNIQEEIVPMRYVHDRDWGSRTTPLKYYERRAGRHPGIAFYKLSEEPGYSLPFQVWGYYDPSPITGS